MVGGIADRRMQFKVGNYRDGDRKSNIRMLTGTIEADWMQLPVEQYNWYAGVYALPTVWPDVSVLGAEICP